MQRVKFLLTFTKRELIYLSDYKLNIFFLRNTEESCSPQGFLFEQSKLSWKKKSINYKNKNLKIIRSTYIYIYIYNIWQKHTRDTTKHNVLFDAGPVVRQKKTYTAEDQSHVNEVAFVNWW